MEMQIEDFIYLFFFKSQLLNPRSYKFLQM